MAQTARAPKIIAAAAAVAVGWVLSLFVYFYLASSHRLIAFFTLAGVHLLLAGSFHRLSRGSWIPVPLCGVNILLALWYFAIATLDLHGQRAWVWVAATANRLFDAEILYLVAVTAYRRAHVKPN